MIRTLSLSSDLTMEAESKKARLRQTLWSTRFFYLLLFGSIGCIGPYLNVYLQQQGLSGSQVGWMNSIPPLVALMANPLWGGIADHWQIHRLILALCALGTGLISLLFLTTDAFWVLLSGVLLLHLFRSPMMALLDSTVMDLAKRTQTTYGHQRLWGSLGFVIASFGLGQILADNTVSLIFWIHAGLLIIGCTLLSLFLPASQSMQRVNLRAGVRILRQTQGYISFLIATILLGFGMSSYVNFMGLYMLKIGGNESQIGLAWAANAIVEIPVMLLAATWLNSIGVRHAIGLGLLGYGVVWTLMGLTASPLTLILLAAASGLCFALLWMAVVNYASQTAPEGLGATAQALVGAAQGGLGWGIGAVTAGYLWDAICPESVFWVAGAVALLGALIFWLGNRPRF